MPRNNTLTVEELREILNDLDGSFDKTPVHIAYNYGDYWHTQVAPGANIARIGSVEWSEYHRMDKVSDEDADEEEGIKQVFIIQ